MCALLAVAVAVAAGLGLLRKDLFWIIVGYVVLVAAIVILLAIGRRQRRSSYEAEEASEKLRQQNVKISQLLAQSQADLCAAREELEASERGYEHLRAVVIQTDRSARPHVEDFDDELADSLERLAQLASLRLQHSR